MTTCHGEELRIEGGRNTGPLRVVVADDDEDLRCLVGDALRMAGFEVTEVGSGVELLDDLDLSNGDEGWTPPYDVIVSDVRMPGVTGLSIAQGVGALCRAHGVVLMSAYVDDDLRAAAQRIGNVQVLSKPFSNDTLVATVRAVYDASLRR